MANNGKRDPIVNDNAGGGAPGIGGGGVANASAGRVKSLPGAGANFTSTRDVKQGWPVPDSPYKGGA